MYAFVLYICATSGINVFAALSITLARHISILCVLSFSMRLLENRKTATQREIYYTFVKHFAAQVTGSLALNIYVYVLRRATVWTLSVPHEVC